MKARKITALLLSCLMILTLAACGKKIDYSAWTYDQYVALGNYDEIYGYKDWNYWDSQEVSYQLTGTLDTVNCPVITNLNKDGSAVMFTIVSFDVAAMGFDWLIPVDVDVTNQVLNVYYGYWTKDGDAITLKYAKNAEEEFITVPLSNDNGTLSGTVSSNWLTYDFECEVSGNSTVQFKTVSEMVDHALSTAAEAQG